MDQVTKEQSEKLLYEQKITEIENKLLHKEEEVRLLKKQNEDFINMAAHDLQAPLRKLSTFIERLVIKSKETLGEELQVYIQKIQSTLTGMQGMVSSLSALSVAEGRAVFTTCSLVDVVNESIKEMEILIHESHTVIDVSALPVIHADPGLLKMVFTNLLENALKFKHPGNAPIIQITTEPLTGKEREMLGDSEGKTYIKIQFTDNGIGFDPVYAEKIFNPFQRLHGKSAYSGNGIGLAICKKIIEVHHGIIYAEGNVPSGSRFILILPEIL